MLGLVDCGFLGLGVRVNLCCAGIEFIILHCFCVIIALVIVCLVFRGLVFVCLFGMLGLGGFAYEWLGLLFALDFCFRFCVIWMAAWFCIAYFPRCLRVSCFPVAWLPILYYYAF